MMKLKTTGSVRLTCPKHRRFDPHPGGHGSVEANCGTCHLLCDAYTAHLAAMRAIDTARQAVGCELTKEAHA